MMMARTSIDWLDTTCRIVRLESKNCGRAFGGMK